MPKQAPVGSHFTTLGVLLAMTSLAPIAHAVTPLKTIRVAQQLSRPLFVTHPPGDFDRIFIVEQTGRIKIRKHGRILSPEFINLDPLTNGSGERGLLGLAFHPRYAENGWFFIHYTDLLGNIVIARYSVSADPDVADPAATTILTFPHQTFSNHNGGWLAFGPDGYLYIASGDGGDHFDPDGNGQDITTNLLGNLLRIDIDHDDFPDDPLRNYAIPPGNPFVNAVGNDEIWAYGLRNPWRCAFDSVTGDLLIADVGEQRREEINFQPFGDPGGRNYGWSCMEGGLCGPSTDCTCNGPALTLPIYDYPHSVVPPRCSITGGEVYRGCAIPDLRGTYFFADYCSAEIKSFKYAPAQGVFAFVDRTAELAPGFPLNLQDISSFGLDAAGEMYVCDLFGGEVFKIVPDVSVAILNSDPPTDAIDARRPIDPDTGEESNWDQVVIAFDPSVPCLTPLDISILQQGGVGNPPLIAGLDGVGADTVRIRFERPIAPIAWTSIRYDAGEIGVRIASLPADVNGDRASNESDAAALVAVLDDGDGSRPVWSTDVNRSGLTTPADILETVDLLNGAGAFDAYNGAMLP